MRTNIDLDERLVKKAMKLSRISTKKNVVHQALLRYVESLQRLNISDLKGKIHFTENYDYKSLRDSR